MQAMPLHCPSARKFQPQEIVFGEPSIRATTFRVRNAAFHLLPWMLLGPMVYCLHLAFKGSGLPVPDLQAACLVAGAFCVVSIACHLWFTGTSVFSFPGAFLGVSSLYLLGFILMFPIHGEDVTATWYVVDMAGLDRGIPLVMLAFSCFLVGSCIALRRRRIHLNASAPPLSEQNLAFARYAGFALYGIAILIVLVATAAGGGLKFMFDGGYSYLAEMQYQETGAALLWGAMAWFLPWGALILAATIRQKKDLPWLILFALPVNVILLLAGDRGGLFVIDILLLIRASLLGLRLGSWRTGLAVALIIVAVPTIMVLRQTPLRDWSFNLLVEALTLNPSEARAFSTDPVSATLIEGGTSYKVLMGTVEMVPSTYDYQYGMDYLKSLVIAMPFFSRVFPDAAPNNSDWLKTYVDHSASTTGLGFLQVAEAYIQFGPLGVAFFFLFAGYGLTRLWQYCRMCTLTAPQLAYILILMNAVLLWVRNEFSTAVRPVVWCFLLLIILPRLLRVRSTPKVCSMPTERPAPQTC